MSSSYNNIIIILLLLIPALFIYTHQLHPITQYTDDQFLIVLKNHKITQLYHYPYWTYHQKNTLWNTLWISNDPQSISLQISLNKVEDLRQEFIDNHTHLLPLWTNLIKNKGYLRPHYPLKTQSQTSHRIKGYKYTKSLSPNTPNTTLSPLYQEIVSFINAIIHHQNLTSLNIRMEDTFKLRILVSKWPVQTTDYQIHGIMVKYLFATVSKDQVPEYLKVIPDYHQNQGNPLQQLSHTDYSKLKKSNTLERRLNGRGFHQWINHTISINDVADIQLQGMTDRCWYEFTDVLPESTYVDKDERRKEITNYETINIEKPAFASKQYFYKYRVPLNELKESGVRKYSYQQPIHFRYPSPSLLNYIKVYLHPIVEARIACNGSEVDPNYPQQRLKIIYKVEENLLYERGTAMIPNGDSSKAKIVSIVTLVVTLIGVLVIIKQLKKD